ncbi:MAG: lysophospholipid acyltransferase family protein [Candidatus Sumerlaeia bacterium]
MKKKRITRKALDWLAEKFAGPVVAVLLRLLGRSLRMRIPRPEHVRRALDSGRPLIAAFWHENLAGIAIFRNRIGHGEVAVMISRSRDGDKLASVIGRLGMVPVRASSSRGAVAGLVELAHYLGGKPGATAAIAPDGPRGPRHEAKPGVALLARKADALIVPIGFAYSNQIVFKSWDRTRLPMPFAKMIACVGPPIDPRQWPGDDHEHAAQLGKLLDSLDRRAQRVLDPGTDED